MEGIKINISRGSPGSSLGKINRYDPQTPWLHLCKRRTCLQYSVSCVCYREGLDGPGDGVLLRGILDAADCGLELGRVCVGRHGDHHLYVVGSGAPLELRLGLDHVFHSAVHVALYH